MSLREVRRMETACSFTRMTVGAEPLLVAARAGERARGRFGAVAPADVGVMHAHDPGPAGNCVVACGQEVSAGAETHGLQSELDALRAATFGHWKPPQHIRGAGADVARGTTRSRMARSASIDIGASELAVCPVEIVGMMIRGHRVHRGLARHETRHAGIAAELRDHGLRGRVHVTAGAGFPRMADRAAGGGNGCRGFVRRGEIRPFVRCWPGQHRDALRRERDGRGERYMAHGASVVFSQVTGGAMGVATEARRWFRLMDRHARSPGGSMARHAGASGGVHLASMSGMREPQQTLSALHVSPGHHSLIGAVVALTTRGFPGHRGRRVAGGDAGVAALA